MTNPTVTQRSNSATLHPALRALLAAVHDPDERQTVVLRFLEGRGPSDGAETPERRLKAWARVVARNLRRSAARGRLCFDGGEDSAVRAALKHQPASTPSAETMLAMTRLVESARRVIATMHPRGLPLFELECEGLLTSGEELADALGITRCNVDKLRQRNREAVRSWARGER